jgi:hypothetical protein
MILFIILGVLFVGAVVWANIDPWAEAPIVIGAVSGVLLFALAIAVPVCRYDDKLDIAQYEAFVESVDYARKNGDRIESAALQIKISEYNAWIGRVRRQRQTFWGFMNHPSVDNLEPLR